MIHLTLPKLRERFGDAKCIVTYKSVRKGAPQKEVTTTLDKVNPSKIVRLLVLFAKSKCYIIDGDACDRPGVRVCPACLEEIKHP